MFPNENPIQYAYLLQRSQIKFFLEEDVKSPCAAQAFFSPMSPSLFIQTECLHHGLVADYVLKAEELVFR